MDRVETYPAIITLSNNVDPIAIPANSPIYKT